jgi:molybdopterin-guanine dinucleotide biosynthesis protein A
MGGRVKALMKIDGRTILDRMLEVLSPRFAAIAISANDPTPYHHTGLPVLPDQVLGQGPLAGLAAALRWCRRPYLLAVAGDMPYPDPRLVELLPLFALYSREVLPVLDQRLAGGQLDARGLVSDERLRVTRVHEPEVRALDPSLRCLTNLNSTTDLAGAVA